MTFGERFDSVTVPWNSFGRDLVKCCAKKNDLYDVWSKQTNGNAAQYAGVNDDDRYI